MQAVKGGPNKFHLFMQAIAFEHFYIELYEKYPRSTKHELGLREKSVIRDIGTLNTFHNKNGYVKVTLTYVSHVQTQPDTFIERGQTGSNMDLPLMDAMYPKKPLGSYPCP